MSDFFILLFLAFLLIRLTYIPRLFESRNKYKARIAKISDDMLQIIKFYPNVQDFMLLLRTLIVWSLFFIWIVIGIWFINNPLILGLSIIKSIDIIWNYFTVDLPCITEIQFSDYAPISSAVWFFLDCFYYCLVIYVLIGI